MLPRDFYKADTIGFVKLARIYSNVASPPIMFALLGLAIALDSSPFRAAMGWFALYAFWVSVFPVLFVLYSLRKGYIAELHMSNTRERYLPYMIGIVGSVVAYALIRGLDGPDLLLSLTIFNIIELVVLAVINLFWLISLHTTGAMATSLLVGLIWGGLWGVLIGVPLTISVTYVRLYLRRHTLAQVVVGWAVGGLTVWLLVWWGGFA